MRSCWSCDHSILSGTNVHNSHNSLKRSQRHERCQVSKCGSCPLDDATLSLQRERHTCLVCIRHWWGGFPKRGSFSCVQGILAHRNIPPLGSLQVPRHGDTVGSYGWGGGSYARGTPVVGRVVHMGQLRLCTLYFTCAPPGAVIAVYQKVTACTGVPRP